MKVDGLAVILAIILLPVILIVTYYIHLQVDTMATENQYNANLLNATYDAMSAFELNTANEDLSSVADSLRSIILACNNTFFNTLAINFGYSNASKELLQPYIPAMLYTLYDGYYIYAPTKVPVVAEDEEETISTDADGNVVDTLITKKGALTYVPSSSIVGTDEKSIKKRKIMDSVAGEDPTIGDIIYEKETPTSTDKKEYTTIKGNAETKSDYILKSYVQYSANYQNDSNRTNVTINYTLDNYITVTGYIGEVYYTKSGYLIDDGLIEGANIKYWDKVEKEYKNFSEIENINETEAQNRILGLKTANTEGTGVLAANYASVKVKGQLIESNFNDNIRDKLNAIYGVDIDTMADAEERFEKLKEDYSKFEKGESLGTELDGKFINVNSDYITDIEYEMQKCKVVSYYISSYIFTNWVEEKLGDLSVKDIKQVDAISDPDNYEFTSGLDVDSNMYHRFGDDETQIFSGDYESKSSAFYSHKLEVIKNSIKYNLNLVISSYTNTMNNSYQFSLPVLTDEEWDKILNNISIVSFMQGWDCGLDIYNNYQIVSSTNNELTVSPDDIYYVEKDKFNKGEAYYHKIDCPHWNPTSDEIISFKSKEVKYDKLNDMYDHKNLACYTCINTGNYSAESLFGDYFNEPNYYNKIAGIDGTNINKPNTLTDKKKKAAYIGLAQVRQNTYKTNALTVSEGYKILDITNSNYSGSNNLQVLSSSEKAKDITKLYITISDVKQNPKTTDTTLKFSITVNTNNKGIISIPLNQEKERTIMVDISDILDSNLTVTFGASTPSKDVSFKIKSIKAIYK